MINTQANTDNYVTDERATIPRMNSSTYQEQLQQQLVAAARGMVAATEDDVREKIREMIQMLCDQLNAVHPLELGESTRCVVRWLHAHGFETTEGDTAEAGKAYVLIVAARGEAESEADRVWGLLAEHGIELAPYGSNQTSAAVIQTYDPSDGSAIIEVLGVDDARLFGVKPTHDEPVQEAP